MSDNLFITGYLMSMDERLPDARHSISLHAYYMPPTRHSVSLHAYYMPASRHSQIHVTYRVPDLRHSFIHKAEALPPPWQRFIHPDLCLPKARTGIIHLAQEHTSAENLVSDIITWINTEIHACFLYLLDSTRSVQTRNITKRLYNR